jgi:hypothetical protein
VRTAPRRFPARRDRHDRRRQARPRPAPRAAWRDASYPPPSGTMCHARTRSPASTIFPRGWPRPASPVVSCQRNRPAIMRWMARNRSSSKAMMMRLPMRPTAITRRPSSRCNGGSTVRNTNGFATQTRPSTLPPISPSSRSRYSSTSGNSGIPSSAVRVSAVPQFELPQFELPQFEQSRSSSFRSPSFRSSAFAILRPRPQSRTLPPANPSRTGDTTWSA